jgi:hypothetical protein
MNAMSAFPFDRLDFLPSQACQAMICRQLIELSMSSAETSVTAFFLRLTFHFAVRRFCLERPNSRG